MTKNEVKGSEKPIYIVAQVGNNSSTKTKKSIGRTINKKDWSAKGGYPIKKKTTAPLVEHLEDIERELRKWYESLDGPAEATKKRIKEKLHEILTGDHSVNDGRTLFEHFDDFLNYQEARGRKPKTVGKYRTTKKKLEEFAPDLSFNDIDEEFYDKFILWLANERKQINKTTNKDLQVISGFLNYCYRKKIISKRLSLYLKELKEADQEIVNLNDDEFSYLEDVQLDDPKLDRTRDLFLFSAHTGVRYGDLEDVSEDKINDGILDMIASKTGVRYQVALSEVAAKILEKYEGKLPVIKNQPLNRNLKELAYACGFDRTVYLKRMYIDQEDPEEKKLYEVISSHSGRKTYISDRLRHGVNEEIVKRTAGLSKNSKSFQRYVRFHEQDLKKAARERTPKNESEEHERSEQERENPDQ